MSAKTKYSHVRDGVARPRNITDVIIHLRHEATFSDDDRLTARLANCADMLDDYVESTERENAALREALTTIMRMDVRGHQLQDRLQFSTLGRTILNKALSALGLPIIGET